MNIRKFFLRDYYTGEEISLQNRIQFLSSPSGLGFENDMTFVDVDGFHIKTSEKIAQVEKSGILVFMPPNAYSNYKTFVDWIQGRERIVFVYQPVDTVYYQNVEIVSVSKSELGTGRTLECEIRFAPTSPIYAPQSINYYVSGVEPEIITEYPFKYDSMYPPATIPGTVNVVPNGQLPSDWQIVINGPVEFPIITAVCEGQIIGKIDLSSVEIEEGETISYNTVPDRAAVFKTSGNFVTDLTNAIGLNSAYPTFFRLPQKKETAISVETTSLTEIKATITVYDYFRSI